MPSDTGCKSDKSVTGADFNKIQSIKKTEFFYIACTTRSKSGDTLKPFDTPDRQADGLAVNIISLEMQ